MSRRRFHASPEAFAPDLKTVLLAADEARHLSSVLRLERGAEVFVFDGAGREYLCRVGESGRGVVQLHVLEEVAAARPESTLRLELAVALLKGEKFDLLVQKATELGVWGIVPLMTKQADVRLRDAAEGARRVARWQRIALEAAKQSGRARLPLIHEPRLFASLVDAAAVDGEWRVMFTERDGRSLTQALAEREAHSASTATHDASTTTHGASATTQDASAGTRTLFAATALVGPEGGWADEELALAVEAGWTLVTLGGRILRAETAAITVTALLQHLLGDLK